MAFSLQKVPPDLRAGRQAAGGRGWPRDPGRGRGWLPGVRAAADRGWAAVRGAVPRGARDSLRHQVRQWLGHVRSRATCPGTRQSAGRCTAACARPATPPRASTASPSTAGPSTARWGTCHISYSVHVHVSQECTEESTVQCYTAEECAPVAATNCVTRPREVCEQVPVQDCR